MAVGPSRFVSALAWCIILWSGYEIVAGVATIAFMGPVAAGAAADPLLSSYDEALALGPWLVAGVTALDVLWLVVGLGLLVRREWARRWLVGLLVLAVGLRMALGVYVQAVLDGVNATLVDSLPGLGRTMTTSTVLNLALTVVSIGILVFLIGALRRQSVREQFGHVSGRHSGLLS